MSSALFPLKLTSVWPLTLMLAEADPTAQGQNETALQLAAFPRHGWKGAAGPAGSWYQFSKPTGCPRHQRWLSHLLQDLRQRELHRDQSSTTSAPAAPQLGPGHAHLAGAHLPKPALREGRGGGTHGKMLSPGGWSQGSRQAFCEGAQVRSGRRVTLRDFQPGSVRLLVGFQTTGVTCYQYQG